MIELILIILGLVFGSFINALVWRIYKQETSKTKKTKSKYSISHGRSMCVHCGHELGARDLVPVLSWLSLRGKCRYCNKPISWQYPLVELATAGLFVSSYIFWPVEITANLETLVAFIVWLILLVGLVALAVYDMKHFILPNKIVFTLMWLMAGFIAFQVIYQLSLSPAIDAMLAAIVGGGFFYVLFQVSSGKWIGGGDVKLGFLLGLILADWKLALLTLFLASLIGTIYSLPLVASKKLGMKGQIPFARFLILAAIIAKIWGLKIIEAYTNLLIY